MVGLIFKVPGASSPKGSQTGWITEHLFATCWNRSYQELFWNGCVPALLQTCFEQIIVKLNSPPPTPAKKSSKEKFVYEACQRFCAIATQAHNQEHIHKQSHFLPVAVKWYLVYTQGSEGSSTHHLTMQDGLYADRKHFFIVSLSHS